MHTTNVLSVVLQVVVVQAISALCQKYPRKHSVMMTFLSNMLRDDVCLKLSLCSYWQAALIGGAKGLLCQWVRSSDGA